MLCFGASLVLDQVAFDERCCHADDTSVISMFGAGTAFVTFTFTVAAWV
jgi:hypothetical protein